MANTQLAITDQTIELLTKQLNHKREGGLKFPLNYSLENAMNAAYLMLKEAETKDKKALLEVCTKESVIQSLMQMATQGLNPLKKQCYFVAYGTKCQLTPSYFGTLAILKRVARVKGEPVANIIYAGDIFEHSFDVETGETKILKHEQKLENIDSEKILGAYAIIRTEEMKVIEIMNIKQLQKAWAQGSSWAAAEKGKYQSKTHTNFTEEMAKKTVLNRACKKIINASDDSSLMGDEFLSAYNQTSSDQIIDVTAEAVAEEIKENANTIEFMEIKRETETLGIETIKEEQAQTDFEDPGF